MSFIMEGMQCHACDINDTSPIDYFGCTQECMGDVWCGKMLYSQSINIELCFLTNKAKISNIHRFKLVKFECLLLVCVVYYCKLSFFGLLVSPWSLGTCDGHWFCIFDILYIKLKK